MDAFQAIVLGIVQGFTEFLPISSTAHLRVIPAFAGWEDPGAAFTAVTQLGTIAAVLLFFRRDLLQITAGWLSGLRTPAARDCVEWRLGWAIIVGTVPISVFGLTFAGQIETSARSLTVVGIVLIVLGILLGFADRVGARDREVNDVGVRDGLLIGLGQAAALVPGASRAGSTITVALLLGLERPAAARFSFLLSVPAIVLAGLFQLPEIGGDGGAPVGPTVLATALAFVSGYAAIAFLLRFLSTHSVAVFVVYRIVLGVLVLALAGSGAIS